MAPREKIKKEVNPGQHSDIFFPQGFRTKLSPLVQCELMPLDIFREKEPKQVRHYIHPKELQAKGVMLCDKL